MNGKDRIKANVDDLLKELPDEITLVAAVKTRTAAEVSAAYEAGIRVFGHNYVQEAQAMISQVDFKAEWHMIGHLQRNKAAQAIRLFDMLETLDSIRLAKELEKRCAQAGRVMPVLIEINSGLEESKSGVHPGAVDELVESVSRCQHLKLMGLMTMGAFSGDAELSRPCFKLTRRIFERLRDRKQPGMEMRTLSMGMSHSYHVAIEEGSNMVRIGTRIFGPRS